MKIRYYPDLDVLYIDLNDNPAREERECANGITLELGANEEIVGLKVEGADESVNFANLEVIGWPNNHKRRVPSWESHDGTP